MGGGIAEECVVDGLRRWDVEGAGVEGAGVAGGLVWIAECWI